MKEKTELRAARIEADRSRARLEEAFDLLKGSVKLSAEARLDQAINGIRFLEANRPLAMLAVYAGGFALGVLLSDRVRRRPVPVRKNEMTDGSLTRLREA